MRAPGTFCSTRTLISSSASIELSFAFNGRRLPNIGIVGRLQIVRAERRYWEFTRLIRIEMTRASLTGQRLLFDLFLQGHQCVQQCLRPRRASRNMDIDWNITVDAL